MDADIQAILILASLLLAPAIIVLLVFTTAQRRRGKIHRRKPSRGSKTHSR